MNIVVIAPSGAVSAALQRLALTQPSEPDHVTVLSWAPVDDVATGHDVVVVGQPVSRAGTKVSALLSTNALGRNILRLTPLDGGRRMARAALREDRVRNAISAADLVAVIERDGILTGWKGVRRWATPDAQAVYGVAAAETLLKIERSTRR